MDSSQIYLLIGAILAATGCFAWAALSWRASATPSNPKDDLVGAAKEDVEHIFNDNFREELRNRGRIHFEKIINDNAMFLQQDLRLTGSQLHDYTKEQITKVLEREFTKYEESINDAKEEAVTSIKNTQTAIEQQRVVMEQQLQKEVAAEKARLIQKFETNMGEIVNHYLIEAIGSEIDLSDQLDYVLKHLEDNKQAISEDIKGGA